MNKMVLTIAGAAVVLGILWFGGFFEGKEVKSPDASVVEQNKPGENAVAGEQTVPPTGAAEPAEGQPSVTTGTSEVGTSEIAEAQAPESGPAETYGKSAEAPASESGPTETDSKSAEAPTNK